MTYETYVNHISAYEREFKTWEGRVDKIIKRYRDDKRDDRDGAKFNVLWSNVQTLKAATYARMPMPDVSRRFKDNDPVGRVAALILERALEFQVQHFADFGQSLKSCIYDRFLGGRGTAWVRYEAQFSGEVTEDTPTESAIGEEVEEENAPVDYVHWKDFGHAVTRTWEECHLVWRKVYLTRKQADERFPDVTLPLDTAPEDPTGRAKTDNVNSRALVYELWDKETGRAVWLSQSVGKIIDTKEDPLGLEEFFPCPRPLFATLTTDTLVPLPDFSLYQDQATELDILSDRIDGLVKALQVKGVYDTSQPELARLFTEGSNGTLLPVKNWEAFAEKKGLQGSISLVDLAPIAAALREAYGAFDQIKGQIYELSGISDILRGETAPSETATAQQIKNSYASLRLKVYQDEVERFATRLLQLKAQIICNHFDPQTILKLAAAEQLSQADQQFIGPAMQMLKGGVMKSFRIEVATDSMVYQDEQQEKQDATEMIGAVGKFLQLLPEVGQMSPAMVPMGVEILKFAVTRFRVGKTLEGTIDQAIDQLKQQAAQQAQQPKPNPDAAKAQAAGQVAQIREQGQTQRAQADQASAERMHAMDQQHEAQMAAIQAQHDRESKDRDWQYQQALAQMQQHAADQQSRTEQMFATMIQRMKSATAIEVAEISKETTLQGAQISAAQSAEASE